MSNTAAMSAAAHSLALTTNSATLATAPISEEDAAIIAKIAERGYIPGKHSSSWGYQKWELYFSKLTRSAPLTFYTRLAERSRCLFKYSQLEFYFLLACVEAPAVRPDCMVEEVRRFLGRHDHPQNFTLLYAALCKRGLHEAAIDIFKERQGSYSSVEREVVEEMLAGFVPMPVGV